MKKKVIILIIIVIVLIISFFSYKIINEEKHTIKGTNLVAYTSLRLAVAEVALGKDQSSLDSNKMNNLENFITEISPKNQWFSENSGTFYIGTMDTSDLNITWISDGTYYATFYVTKDTNILKKYTFSTGKEKGYSIYID